MVLGKQDLEMYNKQVNRTGLQSTDMGEKRQKSKCQNEQKQ